MSDCVGCGYCCSKTICSAGLRIYGPVKLCPALVWDDEKKRHFCKLCNLPGDVGQRYRQELYIGAGCCSSLFNDWRIDVRDRTESSKSEVFQLDRYFKIFLHNLGRQWISKDVLTLTTMAMVGDMKKLEISEETIEQIVKEMDHIFKENRASYLDSFM